MGWVIIQPHQALALMNLPYKKMLNAPKSKESRGFYKMETKEKINEQHPFSGNVSESIWDGDCVIPMAEVSHIEKDKRDRYKGCITVIFKHSKWNEETQSFEPSVYLQKEQASYFLKDWCYYRYELERLK